MFSLVKYPLSLTQKQTHCRMEKGIDKEYMADNLKENDIKLLIEKLAATHSLSLEEYRRLIEGLKTSKTGDGFLPSVKKSQGQGKTENRILS